MRASISAYSDETAGFQPARVLDTLKLARRLLPGRASYKLGALADSFGLDTGLPADWCRTVRRTRRWSALGSSLFATPFGREPLTLADLLDATVGKATTGNAADEPAATSSEPVLTTATCSGATVRWRPI